MLNLLTKTKPWIVASLFAATFLFGQTNQPAGDQNYPPAQRQVQVQGGPPCPPPCPPKPCCPKPDCAPCAPKPFCAQPCPPTQMCPPCPAVCCPPWPVPVLNAAYNYPARVETRCPWGVWFDASFLYWQPIEEGLAPVNSFEFTPPTIIDGPSSSSIKMVDMHFKYKPGFRVGLGFNLDYDNWDFGAEYTWFHSSHKRSGSGGLFEPLFITGPAVDTLFLAVEAADVIDGDIGSYSATWRLNLDIVDLFMGRTYYVGRKLVFNTYFGARGAFIRQKYNNTYGAFEFTDINTPGTVEVASYSGTARTKSWAVGPMAGVDMFWIIGEGFRWYGDVEADVLFTRYKINRSEEITALIPFGVFPTTSDTISFNAKKLNRLRSHLDFETGFGWGTYFDCNNWYLDFSLGYEWQIFFHQNMFFTAPSHEGQDLMIHGGNFKMRLDF